MSDDLNIETAPVESSQIREIGYDQASQTLAVRFKSGGLYHYFGVGPEFYAALREAESLGAFFFKNVKGAYEYKSIDETKKEEAA